jgi:hypothetical protein
MAPSTLARDGGEGVSTVPPSRRGYCSTTASRARWACFPRTSSRIYSHGLNLQTKVGSRISSTAAAKQNCTRRERRYYRLKADALRRHHSVAPELHRRFPERAVDDIAGEGSRER